MNKVRYLKSKNQNKKSSGGAKRSIQRDCEEMNKICSKTQKISHKTQMATTVEWKRDMKCHTIDLQSTNFNS